MLTHLWPRLDRQASVDGGIRGVRRVGRHSPRRTSSPRSDPAPTRAHDTKPGREHRWESARDGREPDELRTVAFTRDFTEFAAGSVLVECGRTRVLCTASVEERVPPWLRGKGRGWVTAEYSMLPGSTPERVDREAAEGQAVRSDPGDPAPDRSIAASRHRPRRRWARCRSPSTATSCRPTAAPGPRRSAVGTSRCTTRAPASSRRGRWPSHPLTDLCAAISVGIVGALPILDLDYSEDCGRRGRHERRDDRRRNVHRGAGNRRGHAVQSRASSTACSASPSPGSSELFDLQRQMLEVPPSPRAK